MRMIFLESGHFYYIDDRYFVDFPDRFLMKNKETIYGQAHGRPCFYAYLDEKTGLFWMIPISSQVEKYRGYYNQKLRKFGRCDTIVFGKVLGREKAFLIQNICPIIPEYIKNEYIDRVANVPVRVALSLEKELIEKAKKVIALHRNGIKLIFPDILEIEEELLKFC